MPETESVTAATEIRDRLEFAVRADTRWKAARDVVNDARRLDRVHGSCVQAITDGFENQVGHGEYAAVFLLEVVRRLNPAVADAAARDLAQVWEDGQVGHERLGEWHAAVSAGQPMRLYIDLPEKNAYVELDAARARIAELEPERDACRRAAQSWLSVVERQCRDVLDATGMHDIIDESGDGDWALVWERIATMGADLRTAQARVAELEAFVADIACHGLRGDMNPTMIAGSAWERELHLLRYLRSLNDHLKAAAREYVPDAEVSNDRGRPRPAAKVEIVADPETELGVLLEQERKGGAR